MNDADLAALLADPEQIPSAEIPRVVGELERIKTSLVGRLVAEQSRNGSETGDSKDIAKDRLLTVQEAAARLGVTTDYLYRNKDLPFRVRLPNSSKALFSSLGIEGYLKSQRRT